MDVKQLSQDICGLLADKKGKDIVIIDVQNSTVLCDYFIICSAKSAPHVKALCDNVEDGIEKKYNLAVKSKDGYSDGRWIVMDYFDIVVHIFNDETRLFYHLERLWSDGSNLVRFEAEEKEATLKLKKTTTKKAATKKPALKKVVSKDETAEAKPAKKTTSKKSTTKSPAKTAKKPTTAKRSTLATDIKAENKSKRITDLPQ